MFIVNRDGKLDSLKFLLVCLVIIGHVVGPYKDQSANMVVKNFIYLFHIPLFVYISGYLSKNQLLNGGGLLRLLETYLVFQILYLVPLVFESKLSLRYLIVPYWLMWYLFSLLLWRLFKILIIDKLPSVKPMIWIVFSMVVAIVSGFIPLTYHFAFQRTCTFLPFFVMGLFTPKGLFARLKTMNKPIPILILIIIVITVICIKEDFSAVIGSSQCYPFYGEPKIISCIYRLVFIAAACLMGVSAIALCPNSAFMASQGKLSLVYYLYHGFLVILMKYLIEKYSLSTNTAILLLISILIITILYFFSKTKIASLIANPFTSITSKKENEAGYNQCR